MLATDSVFILVTVPVPIGLSLFIPYLFIYYATLTIPPPAFHEITYFFWGRLAPIFRLSSFRS